MYQAEIRKVTAQRNKNIEDNRAALAKAEAEGKEDLEGADLTAFRARQDAIERQDQRIADLKRLSTLEAGGDANGEGRASGTPELENGAGGRRTAPHATQEYRNAFRTFLETGEKGGFPAGSIRRDMTMSSPPSGGALLAPASVSADIIKAADDLVFMAGLAKKYPVTNTQATGVRRKTARMSKPTWTSEIGSIGAADSQLAYDRRDLTPQRLAKLVKVSSRLTESGVEVEGEVREELAYQFGTTKEYFYYNGNGVGQPLGIFNTTHPNAISSTRDLTTVGTGVISGDDLISAKYAMKQAYLVGPKACWLFNRTVVQQIRMLKDGQGRYIWREGVSLDKPDTILDLAFNMSEYVPGAIASGNFIGCLMNGGYYAIAELVDLYIQVLKELYAEQGEIGYAGTSWIDGQPMLDEAFVRIKVK